VNVPRPDFAFGGQPAIDRAAMCDAAPVSTRIAHIVGLVLVLAMTACTADPSTTPLPDAAASTTAPSRSELTDDELATLLAVVVPVAIEATTEGPGEIRERDYPIGDALGSVVGDDYEVRFDGDEMPLSPTVRAAISAAMAPGTAVFLPPDPTEGMLLIAAPTVEGDSVIVTYEQRCGGDPDALCGSGGAFRMARTADGWQIAEVLSGWIS
jgi:hypothetical protein